MVLVYAGTLMKYIGIDYGSKRVGLAISDDRGSIAFPLDTVETREASSRIAQLVLERKVGGLVIGDTRSLGGGENPVTKEAEKFADTITRETGLTVSRAFEGWSSVEASRYAPEGKQHDDAAAAAIILQRFLDMRGAK